MFDSVIFDPQSGLFDLNASVKIDATKVTAKLMTRMDENACIALVSHLAINVNSLYNNNIVTRDKPYVDGIVIKGGEAGYAGIIACIRGMSYETPNSLGTTGTLLYLGKNGKITNIEPTKTSGDLWHVIIGRRINQYAFIFDPCVPTYIPTWPDNTPFPELPYGGPGSGDNNLPPYVPDTFLYTDGVDIFWKKIKSGDIAANFAITQFSTPTTVLEVGNILTNPTFTFAANDTIITANINGRSIDPVLSPYTYIDTFTRNTVGSIPFTLNVADNDGTIVSSTINISWLIRRYFGSITKGSDILNLNTDLGSSRSKTFTTNCGPGQNIYYVIPTSFGTPTFYVGGFEGGFKLLGYQDITNSYGITTNYQIWESDNSDLGSTTVTVQ